MISVLTVKPKLCDHVWKMAQLRKGSLMGMLLPSILSEAFGWKVVTDPESPQAVFCKMKNGQIVRPMMNWDRMMNAAGSEGSKRHKRGIQKKGHYFALCEMDIEQKELTVTLISRMDLEARLKAEREEKKRQKMLAIQKKLEKAAKATQKQNTKV